jgi:hypothetical protein
MLSFEVKQTCKQINDGKNIKFLSGGNISYMGLIRGIRDFTPVCKSIDAEATGRKLYWFTNRCTGFYTGL